MRAKALWSAAVLFALAGSARALTCAASFQAKTAKPGAASAWKSLGEVSGAKAGPNCVAMAKNRLGNAKPAELGVSKEEICAAGTISVAIFTRLDAKDKRESPDATVSTSLGVDCPKPAKAAAKKED